MSHINTNKKILTCILSPAIILFSALIIITMTGMDVFSGENTDSQAVHDEKCNGDVTFLGRRNPEIHPDKEETFRTGDVNLEKTSSAYIVIDRRDMEAKAQTLGETLDREAGIQVRNSGGTGSFSSISLRGSESSQVMIFMDGIPLNSASETGVDLGSIPVGDVEKIEIFKGSTPMNFGSASLGGAVNIKTLRSKPGMAGFFSAGSGSYGTKAFSGYFNHKPGTWDYLFSFDSLHSDNDYEIDNDNGTPYNPDDDREEKRKNAWTRQDSFLVKTGCDISGTGRIDFQDQYFTKNQGVPAYTSYNNSENDAWLETSRNIFSASYTADDVTPLFLSTRTGISHTMKREEYDDLNNSIGLGIQHSKYDTDSLDAVFYSEWKDLFNTVEFVAEAGSEKFLSKDIIAGKTAQDAERKKFTAGVQDRIVIEAIDSAGRFSVIPGIRYSYSDDDGRSYTSSSDTQGFRSESRSFFSPQAGIHYIPTDQITLKANVAKYYREPSFFELFGDRGFFEGNEKLLPESGVNFDAGAEFREKCLNEYIHELFFGATYFHDRINDLITRTYDARGVGVSVNVPGAVITGVEGIAGIRFSGKTGIYFSAVLQNPENLSSGLKGNQLPGRFASKFSLKAETGNDRWLSYIEYTGENDMYYDTPNLLSAMDRRFINTGAEYMIHDFALSFDIKNLTDGRYSDYRLYPSPGRSFLFGVKYRFSKDFRE